MAHRDEQREVREFLRERASAIRDLPWEALDRYEKRTEQFTARTGRSYRVVSRVFWDMGNDHRWETDMQITLAAYAPTGWHKWWPIRVNAVRPGPPDVPKPPPT